MRNPQEQATKKDPSHKILVAATGLVGLGVLLLAVSFALGLDPARLAVSRSLRTGWEEPTFPG